MTHSIKYYAAGQLISGDNALYDYCKNSKANKTAFIISDVVEADIGINKKLFDEIYLKREARIIATISKEPDKKSMELFIQDIKDYQPDEIIAIGGGSVIDTAKTLLLFLELPHLTWTDAMKYYQVEKRPHNTKLVACPTTSGTGSEMTGAAMLIDESGKKSMILTNEVLPDVAILDFEFLKTLPPKVIIYSGIDALSHAIEAATDVITDPVTQFICIQSIITLINDLPKSLNGDLEARVRVHVASMFAGLGINHGGCGLSHDLNTPGEDFHLPHGLITGMVLPYTLECLMPHPVFNTLMSQLGIETDKNENQIRFRDRLWVLYDELKFPKSLKEFGIDESAYMKNLDQYVDRFERVNRANSVACGVPTPDQVKEIFMNLYYGKH
ncbi:MAG TPA: iron-containing alcohol dehydrogenase [Erysipelotrichaceae bacterium]|nr:iron-containing alcohol dehydrogenase [Erysipelotrichaceae bacterium]